MDAPTPAVEGSVRQFFDPDGKEYFLAIVYGRRPDVRDALRAHGQGSDRQKALWNAESNWKSAWRSLATQSRSTSD